ncbi:anaerobic c4-dicarboxylate antiporter, DcuC family [Denitrovibrio acetiphilus DSM 12809]|uniref:Anaerobic c4-dicarboxylate antiporter, DcuC family n=1 Tax=Denitrovibrio acetiphilus (strain DSM 12809 / NBRC 114555 / N2460) TaxID=522772 RepID=D4H3U0_DENA2|nr:C4-dicarboxylate transporter DcuC [Denitrovibrio acetiphilus]ADD69192.1 anaerobic c4-dicarboxylate antiporter, DcuC family [Denitrovibrio acetiphilus DSM 12809]
MVHILTILIVCAAGYLIVKKYQTQTVIFAAGLLLLTIAAFQGNDFVSMAKSKSTGWVVFDIFDMIRVIISGRVGKLGLIIMAAGGFAKYMGHIGAARAMVDLTVKPLSKLRSPYVVIALAYLLGQVLNIFIPSASGLAMLLLISMFPILIRLGATPASSAAVIATTACLDLGPASGNSLLGARTSGMDASTYFVSEQLMLAVPAMIVIAVLHFFVQRYFDKRALESSDVSEKLEEFRSKQESARKVPALYAILPTLPLILLLVFSKFVVASIKLNVVTAMFISLIVAVFFELVYTRKAKEVMADVKVFFIGMGDTLAGIVTLIFAAEVFALGLKAVGFIDMLLSSAHGVGLPAIGLLIVIVLIIGITALMTGSGNAAFFSFANLAPDAAAAFGLKAVVFVLPMQLVAGLFRSFSPVAGVVLACAGTADVSPFEVVKRTFIPMAGGVIVVVIGSWFML